MGARQKMGRKRDRRLRCRRRARMRAPDDGDSERRIVRSADLGIEAVDPAGAAREVVVAPGALLLRVLLRRMRRAPAGWDYANFPAKRGFSARSKVARLCPRTM